MILDSGFWILDSGFWNVLICEVKYSTGSAYNIHPASTILYPATSILYPAYNPIVTSLSQLALMAIGFGMAYTISGCRLVLPNTPVSHTPFLFASYKTRKS